MNYSSTCLLVSLNCQQDTVLWHLREKPQLRHFLDHIGQPVYFSGVLFACFLEIYGRAQLTLDGTVSMQVVLNHIEKLVESKLVCQPASIFFHGSYWTSLSMNELIDQM